MRKKVWAWATVVVVALTMVIAAGTVTDKVSGWWIFVGIVAVFGCYWFAWDEDHG